LLFHKDPLHPVRLLSRGNLIQHVYKGGKRDTQRRHCVGVSGAVMGGEAYPAAGSIRRETDFFPYVARFDGSDGPIVEGGREKTVSSVRRALVFF